MRFSVARRVALVAVAGALALGLAAPAGADHAWGSYHWARTSNTFTLRLGDNVSSAWEAHLGTTSSDWSRSTVLDTAIVAGGTTGKRCRPTAGRIEVCNAAYGRNGWLGLAQIWATGSHITQATTKVNDSYFTLAAYNTPAWRNLVMCQEVGHDFGLGHQDESFDNANLGTCMDYTRDPSSNQHPNQHDYDQLATIYSHLDSTSTVGTSAPSSNAGAGNSQAEWGQAVGTDGAGRPDLFVRDLGNGQRLFTHVFWAPL